MQAVMVVLNFGAGVGVLFLLAYTSLSWGGLAACFFGFTAAAYLSVALLTVALKWLLLGRLRPGTHPLWSWMYVRWWLVRGLSAQVGAWASACAELRCA